MVLNNILNENQDILDSNTNNDTRDLTVMFDIREVEAVSMDVSNLTNVSNAIVPNDINTTNNIVDSLIRYVSMCIYVATYMHRFFLIMKNDRVIQYTCTMPFFIQMFLYCG